MRTFDFYSPTYFVFGKDRETETGRYVKRFGGSRVLVVYGGQSMEKQKQQLKKGAQILVATPGRLLDLMQHRLVDLS